MTTSKNPVTLQRSVTTQLFTPPRTNTSGKTPIIYSLATKGIKHLHKQGIETITKLSPTGRRAALVLPHLRRMTNFYDILTSVDE